MDGKCYFYSISNDKPPAMKEIPLKDSLRTIPSDMYSIIPTFFSIYNQPSPRFGKGDKNDFKNHVQQHLQYPLLAEDVWIRGTVYTQFDVDVTGKLINIKSLNKPHQELIDEAFRVLETSPPWIPGFLDNIPHETIYTFPITFILE